MANNRRQEFRLVRVITLRSVWMVFFVFLTFECCVLTMGRLQALCVNACDREGDNEIEGPAPPYTCGGLDYIARERERGCIPP
jgi:hypothetical protein